MKERGADGGGKVSARVPLRRETIFDLAGYARDAVTPPFDPANSAWYQRAIFIVGPPRSGTTWLHQMLSTHPSVASGGEMHAFCEGMDRVFENFDNPDPYMGLSTWITRSELVAMTRRFVDDAFTACADRQGVTEFVLDKSPNHAQCAMRLAEVYPDATFLNIIRDPRDSIGSAHHLWSSWEEAHRNWAHAARTWRANIEDTREHLSGLRYYEFRYEDALERPNEHLERILSLIGLAHDRKFVEDAVEFARAPINVSPSDQRVTARKWDLDPLAERTIIAETAPLAEELGYVSATQREAILARRSWRDLQLRSRSAAGTIQRRARTGARRAIQRKTQPRPQRRSLVIDVSQRLTAAVIANDDSAALSLLGSDPYAEFPDHTRADGADKVIGVLHNMLDGSNASAVMADNSAAAIEVVPSDGPRRSLSCFVHDGLITHIRINDAGNASTTEGKGL